MAAHGSVLGRLIEGRDLQAEALGLLAALTRDGFARVRLQGANAAAAAVRERDAWLGSAAGDAQRRHARAAAHDAAAAAAAPPSTGVPPPGGRGYVSLPGKELFEVALDAQLAARLPPGLLAPTAEALLALHWTAAGMLSALSRALRMQPHGLVALLDELPLAPGRASPCVLHVCRYAQADAAAASSSTTAAAGTQGTEAHHDRGLLTVVVASEAEGLEVQSPTTGVWQRVVLAPGEAALFGGLSLEWATGGLLPAALHRVVPLARDRTSLCYKLRVRPDAVVDVPALLQRRTESVMPRYHAPMTGVQLMETFAASHPLSVNAPDPPAAGPSNSSRGAGWPAGAVGAAALASAVGSGRRDHSAAQAGRASKRERETPLPAGAPAAYGPKAAVTPSGGPAAAPTNRQPPADAAQQVQMQVVVLTNPPRTLFLRLPAGSMGRDFKRVVTAALGVPQREQTLVNSMLSTVEDDDDLAYACEEGLRRKYWSPSPHKMFVVLQPKPSHEEPTFRIKCLRLASIEPVEFNVRAGASVIELKWAVADHPRMGGAPDQMRLVLASRLLADEQLLSHYGIQDGSVVYVVLQLRGD